jgi:ADP-ribosylglycohydrolase
MKAIALARLSLDGLSVGDAFGELFFGEYGRTFFRRMPRDTSGADLPPGPWPWTDDTHMALSVVEVLEDFGHIEEDALARTFVARYRSDPYRGYGAGAVRLLHELADGADWRRAAPALFAGGSYGNGAAMRAAPIGGFFAADPGHAAAEAQRSAVLTHAHPEGQAGAMAVAAAAAIAASDAYPTSVALLDAVLPFVPEGLTREGIARARSIAGDDLMEAILQLGTGSRISAQDTVPFCLWTAAHHLDDYRAALWHTAQGLGDVDTTCAIVGGIVALSSRQVPEDWLARREALPSE